MTTRTWIGGGNNAASNPKDWSPTGAPHPGDTLVMNLGAGTVPVNATINITGYDVVGDLLKVGGNLGTATINATNAVLNLQDRVAAGIVDVNIKGALYLNASVIGVWGHLNFIGGTTYLMGTSSFQATQVLFDTAVTGNGTIDAGHGGNGEDSGFYEFGGFVGGNVTIALAGEGPAERVQIDHPSSFNAKIVIPGPGVNPTLNEYSQPFLGTVLFEGLHITSADLLPHSDVLQMWNGNHLVDNVRLGGDTSHLYVSQSAAGVTLSGEFNHPAFPNLLHQ